MPAPLHIFRAGTYTDMHGREITISASELAAIAAAYDPALHQAPIVVGHPKDNSPAFGWLASLRAQGDDLDGEPIEVDPAFADAVRAGRYKTRSASFWQPDHPANPKPGVWYLRHLGFLGAAAPAVKGLRGADLADDGLDAVTIDFSDEDQHMPEIGKTDRVDTHDVPTPPVDLAERAAELVQQAQELAARERALAEREAALAAAEAARQRAEVAAFAEGLANEARLRPADVPRMTEIILALALHAPEPAAAFAEGAEGAEAVDAATWLRGYLSAQAPLVELAEIATRARAGGTARVSDREIAERARAYKAKLAAQGVTIDLAAAVDAVEADRDR